MTDYFIFELKNREKKERKLLHIRKKNCTFAVQILA
jgi:hypothetical protein